MGSSLVESSAPSVSGSLLLIGSGDFADSLAKTLTDQGVDVERADNTSATTTVDVLLPDLMVLTGAAATSGSTSVLAKLQTNKRATPTLVIHPAKPGGVAPLQGPQHVAHLMLQGGVSDCAERVRALLAAVLDGPSAGQTLQQLADQLAKAAVAPESAKMPLGVAKPPEQQPRAAVGAQPTTASGAKAFGNAAGATYKASQVTKPAAQASYTAGDRTPMAQSKTAEPEAAKLENEKATLENKSVEASSPTKSNADEPLKAAPRGALTAASATASKASAAARPNETGAARAFAPHQEQGSVPRAPLPAAAGARPVSVPSSALSAAAPPRAANVQQPVVPPAGPKPAASSSTALPRGLTGERSAAGPGGPASANAQPRVMSGAQPAASAPSPAAHVESPPSASDQGLQRGVGGAALPHAAPANDQAPPLASEKTAPRISIRAAKRAASAPAPASATEAAKAAAPIAKHPEPSGDARTKAEPPRAGAPDRVSAAKPATAQAAIAAPRGAASGTVAGGPRTSANAPKPATSASATSSAKQAPASSTQVTTRAMPAQKKASIATGAPAQTSAPAQPPPAAASASGAPPTEAARALPPTAAGAHVSPQAMPAQLPNKPPYIATPATAAPAHVTTLALSAQQPQAPTSAQASAAAHVATLAMPAQVPNAAAAATPAAAPTAQAAAGRARATTLEMPAPMMSEPAAPPIAAAKPAAQSGRARTLEMPALQPLAAAPHVTTLAMPAQVPPATSAQPKPSVAQGQPATTPVRPKTLEMPALQAVVASTPAASEAKPAPMNAALAKTSTPQPAAATPVRPARAATPAAPTANSLNGAQRQAAGHAPLPANAQIPQPAAARGPLPTAANAPLPAAANAPLPAAANAPLPAAADPDEAALDIPVGGIIQSVPPDSIRASEIEIALSFSEPPPASDSHAADVAVAGAQAHAPQTPPALPKTSNSLDQEAAHAEVIGSDVALSIQPESLPEQPQPVQPLPLSAADPQLPGAQGHNDLQPTAARTNASASGSRSRPARAPGYPFEPAARSVPQPSAAMTSGAPSTRTGRAPRHPFEPAARVPAQPAATTSASEPSSPNMPTARPQSYPLEPTAGPGGASRPSATTARPPRYPFDPAASVAGGPSKAPARAPRHPFEPAPRAADPAATANARPSAATARPPRYPFEAAAYSERSTTPDQGNGQNVPTARPPRYPFEPAARPAKPQPMAAERATPDADPGASQAQKPPGDTANHATESRSAKRAGKAAKKRARETPVHPTTAQLDAATSGDDAENAAPTRRPPLPFETAQASRATELSPAMLTTTRIHKPRRRSPVWVVGALAAIGCSALWLYRTYDRSADTAPGNAAAAALVQTPALTAPDQPVAVQPAEPIAVVPQPNLPPGATEPAATGPADTRAAGTRRTGSAREVDLTTAAGRAKALVDSGAAMLRERRYGLAEGMYMKALQEVPEFPAALAELVRVHLARRDGREAVRWAERLVAKQDSPLHQLLLGDAQALRGNSDAAQEAWTKAAKGGNKAAQQRLPADDEEDE